MNGWVAKVGDWELFDKDYYRSQKGVVKHGQTIPYDNPTVNSIKPISKLSTITLYNECSQFQLFAPIFLR